MPKNMDAEQMETSSWITAINTEWSFWGDTLSSFAESVEVDELGLWSDGIELSSSANNSVGQYHLNLHVLGVNDYSTFAEIIKDYHSMTSRFHPDNNYEFDTT